MNWVPGGAPSPQEIRAKFLSEALPHREKMAFLRIENAIVAAPTEQLMSQQGFDLLRLRALRRVRVLRVAVAEEGPRSSSGQKGGSDFPPERRSSCRIGIRDPTACRTSCRIDRPSAEDCPLGVKELSTKMACADDYRGHSAPMSSTRARGADRAGKGPRGSDL